MSVLHIVVPILLGALIGYCTNYLAIKMLFRPRTAKHIGSWQLPLTPGVIPKNQPRLARAVGQAVSEQLVTPEAMQARLDTFELKEKFSVKVSELVCDQDIKVEEYLGEDSGTLTESLITSLSSKISSELAGSMLEPVINFVSKDAFGDIMGNPLFAAFLGEDFPERIKRKINTSVNDYLEDHADELIEPYIREKVQSASGKQTGEVLKEMGIGKNAVYNIAIKVYENIVIPVAATLIESLDVETIVREKIEEMDVAELEELTLSVMKNELQMVINLGALIGAVIGAVNILI